MTKTSDSQKEPDACGYPVNSEGDLVNAKTKGKEYICQLQEVIQTSPPARKNDSERSSLFLEIKLALKRKLGVRAQKRIKNAISFAFDIFKKGRGRKKRKEILMGTEPPNRFQAGDLVRVRSTEEIRATLDHWRSFKGCGFLPEMEVYCGTTQRVFKRVERFIDERDFRAKKGSGIVLLDGVLCSGTGTTGRCDRSCFFFWREEWLEKLGDPSRSTN